MARATDNAVSMKEVLTAFLEKLKLYWSNIGCCEFMQFPFLTTVDIELQDDNRFVYVEHLKHSYSDVQVWFSDLLDMNILVWVVDLFGMNVVDIDITLQECLIKLQSYVKA
ncbi:uncharacterized protein LOC143228395 [Tachypleus tridentatus]|uniref:uncharacterized protein LOC143228395 n=1 Tax=Tachypleus tridentatus TaxID=6853 RepID=UPI003FD3456B